MYTHNISVIQKRQIFHIFHEKDLPVRTKGSFINHVDQAGPYLVKWSTKGGGGQKKSKKTVP